MRGGRSLETPPCHSDRRPEPSESLSDPLFDWASMQAAFQKEEISESPIAVVVEPLAQEVHRDGPKDPLDVGLEAARVGDEDMLRNLLESGWSISTQDKYGGTAIHWAAGGGHLSCCKHWAARNGKIEVCQWLVDTVHVDPDIATFDATTPFQLAIWQGHLHVCDWLIEKGIDVHQVNDYGCNASHWVAMSGKLEACKWLMDKGIDMARPNGVGHTCLHKAAQKGQAEFCRFVHSHVGLQAAHMAPDGEGKTPAFLAAEADHTEIAAWIDSLPPLRT